MIRQRANGKKIHIAAIGLAGEKLVRTACIVHGHNVAGRTGMGAVMGSKNLKAVVVSDEQTKAILSDNVAGLYNIDRSSLTTTA